jgi:HPt (histidine-containing phosphotransfer) domain-containing protein
MTDPLSSDLADDPDMAELIEMFLAELPDRIAAVRTAIAAGQRDQVKRLAHQLKGAAGGYGYPAITDAAADLEHAAAMGAADLRQQETALVRLCRSALSVTGRTA